ncbi:MAG: SgcJ/EcaC family oxidoreductase [bacterium]
MKETIRLFLPGLLAALLVGFSVETASAQDPTKVDAQHYKVVFENDQVRVVRITYGAGEKSVMHYHPDAVAVFMSDNQVKFSLPNGEAIDTIGKTGQAIWTPAGQHLPQNTGDQPMEVVLVEMKGKHDAATLRTAIEAENAKFMAAFNRGDAAGVAALYTEKARVGPPNSEVLQGREAIQSFMQSGFTAGLKDLTLTTVSVDGSGDTAYENGTYTLKIAPEGQAAMTDSGKYLAVWKQQADGGWKLHTDIWNSSLPLSGTN